MREIGFTSKVFSPDSIVGQLSGGERQGVALARAIYNKADLIVMDEPTTALSLTETEKVFRFVRAVRAGGRSVLFIGHNIHHVFDIAERFVVMDRGMVALQATKEEIGSAERLIAYMERLAHPQGIETRLRRVIRRRRPRDRLARTDRGAQPKRLRARLRAPAGASSTQSRRARHACRLRGDDRDLHGREPERVPALADLRFGARHPAGARSAWWSPLVFVVTVGEIDLSFPATMGFSAWIFALVVHVGLSPFLGIVAALLTGMALGAGVGALVVTAGLSSLIATLGMNYMLRGFILIVTQGKSIALLELQDTTAGALFGGELFGIPVQIFWALGFVVFAGLLFNRHRFGARVRAVGDNPDSAAQMGVNVPRVRISPSCSWASAPRSPACSRPWSTSPGGRRPATAISCRRSPRCSSAGRRPGAGSALAGGAIGALMVSFIQSGIVAAGLSGFYVQFFNGLIIVLALLRASLEPEALSIRDTGRSITGRLAGTFTARRPRRLSVYRGHKTLDRLTAARSPGESHSDVIVGLAKGDGERNDRAATRHSSKPR